MRDHLKWSTFAAGLNKIIPISVFIVLAQKIPPSDFGVFAIISILFGFVKLLLDAGFKDAIIYRGIDRDSPVLSSIFCFLIAVSLFLAVSFNLLKDHAAHFFDINFAPYMFWISLLFPLLPIRVINQSLLESNMRFRAVALIEITAQIIAAPIAIFLAYNGFGVFSLVVMLISNELLQILLYWVVSSWKIKFYFSWREFNTTYDYSKHLVVYKLVNFFVDNIDKLLIGKFLGKADVGVFHRTQHLTAVPAIIVSNSIVRVFFPYISSNKENLSFVRSLHVNTITAILLFFMPLMSILIVFSDELILLVLNEKWRPMIPLLEVFAVMGVFRVVGFASVNIYKSLGHTKLQNKINFILKVVLLVAILIGIQFNVYGLAISLLLARIINSFITQYNICSIIDYSLKNLFYEVAPLVVFSVFYVFISVVLKEKLMPISNIFVLICATMVYLVVFYLLMAFLFKKKINGIKYIITEH